MKTTDDSKIATIARAPHEDQNDSSEDAEDINEEEFDDEPGNLEIPEDLQEEE